MPISSSALKVQYDLRPAKQVERRMLVDAFQRLSHVGFHIRDYQYTGFGSLYFIDFILFHKLLGLNKMLSIEHDVTLEKRVRFNCPFDCIQIAMNSAKDVIPTLSLDLSHILWLDYDFPLNKNVLADVCLATSQLSRASILLITVDVEPPDRTSEDPNTSKLYFEEEAGDMVGLLGLQDYVKSKLPETNMKILNNAISEGMAGRHDVEFCPLFYFVYADGHRMLTIGGMIGSDSEKTFLRSLDTNAAFYFRTDFSSPPYEIKVPHFTRKERHFIDSSMPCGAGWQPSEFTLPTDSIEVYSDIYRFLPAYAELLL